MPDAPTPAAALPDDGATARRGLAGRHLAPRGVAVIALAAAVTTAVSGCGDDSTADASTSTIAPSDMSRIAAGNTPRSSSTDPSTSLRSAASSAPATSRSASVASSAPGTTSKAGAAAVVIPDAAKAHTKDGAKAFVKFYWETLDQLDAAPKENVLANLYAPTCTAATSRLLGWQTTLAPEYTSRDLAPPSPSSRKHPPHHWTSPSLPSIKQRHQRPGSRAEASAPS